MTPAETANASRAAGSPPPATARSAMYAADSTVERTRRRARSRRPSRAGGVEWLGHPSLHRRPGARAVNPRGSEIVRVDRLGIGRRVARRRSTGSAYHSHARTRRTTIPPAIQAAPAPNRKCATSTIESTIASASAVMPAIVSVLPSAIEVALLVVPEEDPVLDRRAPSATRPRSQRAAARRSRRRARSRRRHRSATRTARRAGTRTAPARPEARRAAPAGAGRDSG